MSVTLTMLVLTLTVLFMAKSTWAVALSGVILSLLLDMFVSVPLPVTLTTFSIIPEYAIVALIVKVAVEPFAKSPIYQILPSHLPALVTLSSKASLSLKVSYTYTSVALQGPAL